MHEYFQVRACVPFCYCFVVVVVVVFCNYLQDSAVSSASLRFFLLQAQMISNSFRRIVIPKKQERSLSDSKYENSRRHLWWTSKQQQLYLSIEPIGRTPAVVVGLDCVRHEMQRKFVTTPNLIRQTIYRLRFTWPCIWKYPAKEAMNSEGTSMRNNFLFSPVEWWIIELCLPVLFCACLSE